jgi:hypothetical protein
MVGLRVRVKGIRAWCWMVLLGAVGVGYEEVLPARGPRESGVCEGVQRGEEGGWRGQEEVLDADDL